MDRFDLEQQMFDCWSVLDQLDTLVEAEEEIDYKSILKSISTLYNIKFRKMFDTFESVL